MNMYLCMCVCVCVCARARVYTCTIFTASVIINVDFLVPAAEWFTSRTSACGLFVAAYPNATNNTKGDLRG